ncbi:MAG: fatty acid desaturase [Armatimonadetes bacterium]|nr:fatty acid desaturase [Armatimonadota bacterium]MDW8122967.1 fatty acid desaturase [Armatimonadota bacterium]
MKVVSIISHKEYVSVLRSVLPAKIFQPVPHRLLWLVPHSLMIALAIWLVAAKIASWWLLPFLSLIVGNSFASLGFLGHEIMHGAVIRKKWVQYLTAGICFSPFFVGPTMWRYWHNVQHHIQTQKPDADPDTAATYADYQRRPALQWLYRLVRRNGPLFFVMLSVWFSFHSTQMFWRLQKAARGRPRLVLWMERLIPTTAWFSLLPLLGLVPFFWVYVLPLLIGNFIAMSYIATNHLLNPQMDEVDPVVGSLSLIVPKWMDILHLHFSHHIEHHLFPAMSHKFAPIVKEAVKEIWPDRYAELTMGQALRLLWRTPRLYLDHDHLIDPVTSEIFQTIHRGLDPEDPKPVNT